MAKQEKIYSFFLLGILAVSLYFAYQVLAPFFHDIVIAIILASLFYPLQTRLKAVFKGNKTIAAVAVTLFITLVIIVPMFLFTGALVSQAAKSAADIQAWLRDAHLEKWLRSDALSPYIDWINRTLPWLEFDISKLNIQASLLDFSRKAGQLVIDTGAKTLGSFLGGLLNFLLMLFVLFFLLRDGETMLAQVKYLSPLHDEQEDRILTRLRDVARSVVVGSFLVAICQGIAGGIGLAIVGIPPIFWGAMMGFASLVPVVGTFLIWGPAALYLFLMGDWKGALIIAAWGAVIVSGIDSIVRPLLMQGRAKMSTFWVFLSIIGGIQFFGPLGVLYGPMVLALAMVMLLIYAEEYSDLLESKSSDPEAVQQIFSAEQPSSAGTAENAAAKAKAAAADAKAAAKDVLAAGSANAKTAAAVDALAAAENAVAAAAAAKTAAQADAVAAQAAGAKAAQAEAKAQAAAQVQAAAQANAKAADAHAKAATAVAKAAAAKAQTALQPESGTRNKHNG